MNTNEIVNSLLEGEELSDLLKNPKKDSIVGKIIEGCKCPGCGEEDALIVDSVLDEDQGFYTIMTKCSKCDEPFEMEIVMDDTQSPEVEEGKLSLEGKGRIFGHAISEGIMTGNYLKFSNKVKAFLKKNERGEYDILFDEPEGESKQLNTRVIFKVISFRNGKAKLVSMVNDKFNNDKAGTIYYADKSDLQNQAKVSSSISNAKMAERYA